MLSPGQSIKREYVDAHASLPEVPIICPCSTRPETRTPLQSRVGSPVAVLCCASLPTASAKKTFRECRHSRSSVADELDPTSSLSVSEASHTLSHFNERRQVKSRPRCTMMCQTVDVWFRVQTSRSCLLRPSTSNVHRRPPMVHFWPLLFSSPIIGSAVKTVSPLASSLFQLIDCSENPLRPHHSMSRFREYVCSCTLSLFIGVALFLC